MMNILLEDQNSSERTAIPESDIESKGRREKNVEKMEIDENPKGGSNYMKENRGIK